MEAALAASRGGNHHVLTDFVAKYDRKELSFSRKSLGDSAACAVAEGLKVNKTLTSLDLENNEIGDAGAQEMGEALRVNTCLATLILYGNDIGDAGATAIAKALQGTNLQELVLQSSKIAHHSYFQELLVWISKHQHLRRLRLNAIGLTDDDLSVLVSSDLTFLEELDLRSNQLTTVPAELGDPKRFGKLQKLLVSRNAELLKRDDELGRRARSDVNVLGVDAGIQVLQLLRLGSSKLKQIPRTRLQLVTVGNFKVGKSTLLERGCPVWLALALAVIVRPHEHPFYGLKTNRGGVSRQDVQKALLEERWPASMVPTLSEQEASEEADDAAIDAKKKAKRASQADRRKSKMDKCQVCNKAWTMTRKHHYCHKCYINVCSGCSESISRKRLCLHCKVGPKLAREEDVAQVLRFLQMLDVIAPLSHKHESLSAAAPAPEPTEDSQAAATQPLPLFRQPSTDISSAEKVMIPSSVGERYSGVIFAPRDLGLGFGERCLAAGRLAIYFGTHEFCFREVDQPHPGDKGAVRVVLDEQGRELFLCVAGSKGFLFHYASSFVREVLTVLRLPRWGRAEESACVAHLLCQNCVLKGRGPARDTSQAGDEICEVLDEQPWATGREGLTVLWGLSRHDDVRGQQAKAEKGKERGLDLGGFDFCTFDRKDEALKDASVKEIVAKVNAAVLEQHGKMGKPCWLDVEMEKRDEKAMEKGVQKSKAFIAIVTDDGKNSYFSREFCRKEVRWALAAGKHSDPQTSQREGNSEKTCTGNITVE
eukprot:g55448.t1